MTTWILIGGLGFILGWVSKCVRDYQSLKALSRKERREIEAAIQELQWQRAQASIEWRGQQETNKRYTRN